jgi:hypothetical protein
MRATAVLVLTLILTACASTQDLRPGMDEAQALRLMPSLTGRHSLPDGGTRLEFARGPMGRDTWMLDFDRAGRLQTWHNALEEPRLHALQQRVAQAAPTPQLTREELLRTLGRPADRRVGGWTRGGELWSWRYPTNDCLWFQATLNADNTVRDAGFGIDALCDVKDRE